MSEEKKAECKHRPSAAVFHSIATLGETVTCRVPGCKAEPVASCDWLVGSHTCDRLLCKTHSMRDVEKNEDYCPEHSELARNARAEAKTLPADGEC